MSDTFQYAARPGSAGLSILSFAGLSALTAFLWQIAPGYVLLLMVPALLGCLWQVTRVPTCGISMSKTAWKISSGNDELSIPTDQIAFLKVENHGSIEHVSVVLNDGTRIMLPADCLPDPYDLIREATDRNIPVREAA